MCVCTPSTASCTLFWTGFSSEKRGDSLVVQHHTHKKLRIVSSRPAVNENLARSFLPKNFMLNARERLQGNMW